MPTVTHIVDCIQHHPARIKPKILHVPRDVLLMLKNIVENFYADKGGAGRSIFGKESLDAFANECGKPCFITLKSPPGKVVRGILIYSSVFLDTTWRTPYLVCVFPDGHKIGYHNN